MVRAGPGGAAGLADQIPSITRRDHTSLTPSGAPEVGRDISCRCAHPSCQATLPTPLRTSQGKDKIAELHSDANHASSLEPSIVAAISCRAGPGLQTHSLPPSTPIAMACVRAHASLRPLSHTSFWCWMDVDTASLVACSCSTWLPTFRQLTARSTLIELPDAFLDFLVEDGVFVGGASQAVRVVCRGYW